MNSDTHLLSAEESFLQNETDCIHQKISVNAYFKAEKRSFAQGHALDDWLEAEAEVLAGDAISFLEPEE